MIYDVVILGSGPAGYTAALYASRANLSVLLLEGIEVGGQLMITTDVENYPGFPDGIMGPELMQKFKEQVERFGTECRFGSATSVDFTSSPFAITVDEQEVVKGRGVIIATGAQARWLGLESETRLKGYGVSACATCDGFFFKDKEIAVVGGGDSAMEEANFLTKFASKVTVIHRRDKLRASKIMQDRALANPKIEFLWNHSVTEVLTETGREVVGLKVENTQSGEESTIALEGLFLAIGHDPTTQIFRGIIDLDESGYIVPEDHTMTNIPGVFAAGDCVDHRYRQAVTAAGLGCQAALDLERWLEDQEHAG
ncbi:MAG: thioredoxin-disulfide reductase [Myxococcales bacterium]|nr:thioredoxin-disulfide reductase [Myxococcales bacterium]